MNLAARRLILFFFSLATLASCEDPTDIGLELQDENLLGTTFVDTLTINSGTVLLNDSILSFRQSPALVGKYADPALGTVATSVFTEVGLGNTVPVFGTNPVADSLVLTLDYNALYGSGSAGAGTTINVYRLREGFQDRASYFTNSRLAYDETPLGTATVIPQMLQKKKTGEDSTTAKNYIRVKLSQALATELVSNSGGLQNQQSVNNVIPGIAIVPNGSPSKIMYINFVADTSKLTLFYKEGGSTDKKRYSFRFNMQDTRFFNRVTGDRTGTAIANLQAKGDFVPATQTGGESYVQTNTQLLTKISIPYLNKIVEKEGKIIINRAELIVPIKNASRTQHMPAPPQLVLYHTNSTNQILRTANSTPLTVQTTRSNTGVATTGSPVVLFIPEGKSYYTANITPYIQAVMSGNKPNYDLLLGSTALSQASQQQPQRDLLVEPRPFRAILTNTNEQPIRLLLYYSKLN